MSSSDIPAGNTWLSRTIAAAQPVTMMAWIRLDDLDLGGGYTHFWGEDDVMVIGLSGGNLNLSSAVDDTGSAISLSTWYHIAWTRTGNAHVVYLNGVSDISVTRTGSSTDLIMGAYNSSGFGPMDGQMVGIKMWTAQLSQAEVLAEMRYRRPQRAANLTFWNPGYDNNVHVDWSNTGGNWTVDTGTPGTSTEDPGVPFQRRSGLTYGAVGAGAFTLTAAQASFTLTGQAATLTAQRKLTTTQQTYTLTGNAAGLNRGYTLSCSAGSFTLTGNAAGLTAQRKLTATQQTYTLTGNAAGLNRGYPLSCSAGSFTLTGNAAGLLAARRLTADQASFSLTGVAAGLLRGLRMTAAQGSFALTGQDATLTHGGAGAFTLTAEAGSFTLTGNAAGLLAARRLTATQASFALTGGAAGLLRGYPLLAAQAAFALTGNVAGLRASRRLTADVGLFALTGFNAGLTYSGAPPAGDDDDFQPIRRRHGSRRGVR